MMAEKKQYGFEKNAHFTSDRLSYRGIVLDDAEKLVRWRSRPEIFSVSANARPISREEHIDWFTKYVKHENELRLIFTVTESNKDIGMVGGVVEDGTFILSYYIGEPDFRGKGYASEAIISFARFMKKTYGISYFEAHIKADNILSISCIKGLGFSYVGTADSVDKYQIVL